ncbi:hypothetical protein B0A48_14220 [Cryoendolithus antarcticus]|uniref:Protein transport protein sec16 n=1 Tax=Cryoendolithus antarcticus TaxID=1507870 RepID=A0A1V8SLH4_9PEZI|nr:hypothetical protein B0A48_14220 [Cryoendolithus antarcticus]
MEPAEDDSPAFPDFGSAFPSPVPAAPSTSETPLSLPHSTPSKAIPSAYPSRPSAAEEDDDFFDRYPGATPDKLRNRQPPADVRRASISVTETVDVSSRAAGEGDRSLQGETRTLVEGETGRRGSIMVVESVDVSSRGAREEERGIVPGTRTSVEPSGEQEYDEKVGGQEREADEEAAVFAPDESAEAQAAHLEEVMPSATLGVQAVITPEEDLADERSRSMTSDAEAHPPEEHYEHQGEITELEEALDESVAAPLMDDEEPAPTVASRTATMQEPEEELLEDDSDEENVVSRPPPQPLQPAHAVAERSFTTNFTDLPRASNELKGTSESRQAPIDEEWPAAGDDKTFGDLLDTEEAQVREVPSNAQATYGDQWPEEEVDNDFLDDAPPQLPEQPWSSEGDDDTFGQILGNEPDSQSNGITSHDDAPVEEDLSAAWAAAMDDDEILNEAEIDPKAFFGDDDELLDDEPFLMDLAQDEPPQAVPDQARSSRPSYAPANSQNPMQHMSYGAPSTPFLDQTSARSGGTPSTGLFDVYNHAAPVQPQQRPPISTAQSFADKSKGGYQSPYDLPMDVVKPRRRPQQTSQPQSRELPRPPPRTSSFHGAPPVLSPPNSSHGVPGTAPPTSARMTPKTDAGFFAELPMASKPRTRPSGAYTLQLSNTPAPPMPNGQHFPPRGGPVQSPQAQAGFGQQLSRPAAPPTPQQQQPQMLGGLRQPERNPLFPDQPPAYAPQFNETPPTPASGSSYGAASHMPLAAPPPSTNRFSPAPPPSAAAPAATSRYSPAPPAQPQQQQYQQPLAKPVQRQPSAPAVPPPSVNRAHSFVPRTSSPLAQHGRPTPAQYEQQDAHRSMPFSPSSPPTTNGLHLSPQRRESGNTKYTPPSTSAGPQDSPYSAPPQRPRTQSPGTVMKTARIGFTPLERPGSTGPPSSMYGSSAPHSTAIKAPVHRRQFSREMSFAVPQDERAQDPLERWKGHAIFKWGPSGTVVTSFPKHMPFYGHGAPTIKCTPGDIKLQDAKDVLPLSDRDVKFPGPLQARSKGKKKELLAWMSGKIEDLERETEGAMLDFSLPPDAKKRVEEKLVLWKLTRIYLEHDGVLEGTPKLEEEVRRILLPNLAQLGQVAELQSPTSATVQPDPIDPQTLAQLRQALFEGQRERAVWLAEEKKLWGHAMLIASTMGPDVWKQIVGSFVRSQVKSVGSDARSLAALYQVFAGSADDVVDELVPPSARAGFRMISKSDGVAAGNPLDGLDQWRETLALVTSNRTPGDAQSLVSLGKLLAGYDRVEAAHCCFLFARSLAKHSGADDPETHFVLLGGNATTGDANLDAITLTEIYEYASSLSLPSSAAQYIPHLQAYKLLHGQQLAAYGLKAQAEAYCAHIDAAIRATTKPSGYYHQALAQELINFNAFLSQTPHTGSSGKFFSKPAMDKVSSGVGSWLSKFVAGDEGEGGASGLSCPGQVGTPGEGGPFGGVNGGSGAISRSASGEELYNPMLGNLASPPLSLGSPFQHPASTGAAGRYAPGAQATSTGSRYAPSVPSQFAPSRSSMDSDRSADPPQQFGASLGLPSAEPIRPASARYASYAPASVQSEQQSPQLLGVPGRPAQPERALSDYSVPYASGGSGVESRRGSAFSGISTGSYEPKPLLADQDGFGSYTPPVQPILPSESPELEVATENPWTQPEDPEGGSGYAPPEAGGGGYEPPAYVPYQPDPDSDDEAAASTKAKPKKRSMLDDEGDDDMLSRAAALKSSKPPPPSTSSTSSKSAADAAADAAFRAAAEADAARDAKPAAGGKGWLGGWFGGKNKGELGAGGAAAPAGPIRAKLGEENSFYFDKDLGKWVNKKAGPEAAAAAAVGTPPPPKGMGSRGPSGAMAMGPPSRAASGASLPPLSSSFSSAAAAAGMGGAGSGSRPPTSSGLSNASAAAMLMGTSPALSSGPPSRAGTPASGPAGRVVSEGSRPGSGMSGNGSQAGTLEELLGPAGAKKGGTVKGKKRGGRYVDVMAGK